MWASHGDYKAERDELDVEPYNVRRETPRPDFYLSAAPAPYIPYDELNDPALVGYYARPRRRKILLQHGIIHPRDYRKIFGADNGQHQSTHDTLMRVNRMLKSRMKEPKAERDLLPYLPDAMKRLLRAGLKMEDRAVEAAKSEMMSRPLDYVIIRLEEQLRAVKHALYLQKQPTVAKNMEKYGFTGFVHNGKEDDPELPAKIHALEREQEAVGKWEIRVHKATEDHLKGTRTERMMAKIDYDVAHHKHEPPPPSSQQTDPKAREEQHKQRHAKAETQTAKHKGVATDKDEKEAQTTEKVETADKQHQGREVKPTPRPPFMIKTTKKQADRVATVKKNKEKAKAKEWHPPPPKKIEGTPFWLRSKEKRPKSAPVTSDSKRKTDQTAEGEVATKDANGGETGGASAGSEAPASQPGSQATSQSEQKEGESRGGQSSGTAEGTAKSASRSKKTKKADREGASAGNKTSKRRKRPKSKKTPAGSQRSVAPAPSKVESKLSGKHLLSQHEVPNTTHDAMASDLTAFGKLSPPQTISDIGFDLPPDNPEHARSPPIPVDETQMKLEHEAAQYNPQSMRNSLHPELNETLDAEHPNEPRQSDPLEPPTPIERPPSPYQVEEVPSRTVVAEPVHVSDNIAAVPPPPAEVFTEPPVDSLPEQRTELPPEQFASEQVAPETDYANPQNQDASYEPPATPPPDQNSV